MKSVIRLIAFGITLVSASVFAEHRTDNHGVVRVHIPVHVHGKERLSLRKMIQRRLRVDLDHYSLTAVVVHGSQGHTRLTIGRYSSPTVHLNHHKVRINAPSKHGDRWRLHLSPDTTITAVTAILEPRQRHAHRGYAKPGFDLGWLWRSHYSDHEYPNHHRRNQQVSQRSSLRGFRHEKPQHAIKEAVLELNHEDHPDQQGDDHRQYRF